MSLLAAIFLLLQKLPHPLLPHRFHVRFDWGGHAEVVTVHAEVAG